MAQPFIIPKVTTRRITGLSLEALAKRVGGAPNFVRVGLPDTEREEDPERT
jgi:hypothetical protein